MGIDGYSDTTVEQIGTEQDVVNGSAVYDAWWEMYSSGKGQPEQIITGMTIKPGDSITASVQYITSGTYAGDFELSIVDNSRANDSFTTYESSSQTQSPLAQRTSAEWIVEAPTVGGSIAAVADFGSVTFTNASATINGVSGPINASSWQSQAINMGSRATTVRHDLGTDRFGDELCGDLRHIRRGRAVFRARTTGPAFQSGTAAGTNQSGKKTAGTVLIGPAWTGASVLSGFRTPVRQLNQSTPALFSAVSGIEKPLSGYLAGEDDFSKVGQAFEPGLLCVDIECSRL